MAAEGQDRLSDPIEQPERSPVIVVNSARLGDRLSIEAEFSGIAFAPGAGVVDDVPVFPRSSFVDAVLVRDDGASTVRGSRWQSSPAMLALPQLGGALQTDLELTARCKTAAVLALADILGVAPDLARRTKIGEHAHRAAGGNGHRYQQDARPSAAKRDATAVHCSLFFTRIPFHRN